MSAVSASHWQVMNIVKFFSGVLQEHMVDALALRGDEGRGVTAISFGEVSSNL